MFRTNGKSNKDSTDENILDIGLDEDYDDIIITESTETKSNNDDTMCTDMIILDSIEEDDVVIIEPSAVNSNSSSQSISKIKECEDLSLENVPGISYIKYTGGNPECNLCLTDQWKTISDHCRSKEHCLRLLEKNNKGMYKWIQAKNFPLSYILKMALKYDINPDKLNKEKKDDQSQTKPFPSNPECISIIQNKEREDDQRQTKPVPEKPEYISVERNIQKEDDQARSVPSNSAYIPEDMIIGDEQTRTVPSNSTSIPENMKIEDEQTKTISSQKDDINYLKDKDVKYSNVFIVGNSNYHPYLKNFQLNKNIELKLNSCLSVENVKQEFIDMKIDKYPNSLWLLFFGVECIGNLKYWTLCENNLCKSPIYHLHLNAAFRLGDIDSVIKSTMQSLKSLEDHLRSLAGRNSDVILMPLAPISIDRRKIELHNEFHKRITPPFYVESNQVPILGKILNFFLTNSSSVFHWEKRNKLEVVIAQYNSVAYGFNDQESVKLFSYIKCVTDFIKQSISDSPKIPQNFIKNQYNESNSNEVTALQFGRFKHVVFIGMEELLLRSGFQKYKNITYIPSMFPINWITLHSTLIRFKQIKNNVLVIIVYDVCALFTRMKVQNKNFYYYKAPNMRMETAENNLIDNVKMLYKKCVTFFDSLENILIAPLMPRWICNWPPYKCDQKKLMDNHDYRKDFPVYVQSIETHDITQINKFHRIFFREFAHKNGANGSWPKTVSGVFCSADWKIKRLTIWRSYINEYIKTYGDKTNMGKMKIFKINISDKIKVDIPKRKLSEVIPEADVMVPNKRQTTGKPLSIKCPNFHSVIGVNHFDISDKLLNSLYTNIYIIASAQAIEKFSSFTFSVPVTFIDHEFSESVERDVAILKDKLTPLKDKSVCVVLFDINFFVNKSHTEGFCQRNKCQDSLTLFYVRDKNESAFQSFVSSKLRNVSNILAKCTSILPCFPAPLPPHSLFCDFLDIDSHNKLHLISGKSYMGMGTKHFWELYWNFLLNEWTMLLNNHYKKISIIENVNKFIEEAKPFFYNTQNDPSSITDQRKAWSLYKYVLTQLIIAIMIQPNEKEVVQPSTNMVKKPPGILKKSRPVQNSDNQDQQTCEVKVWNIPAGINFSFITGFIQKMSHNCRASCSPDGSVSSILTLRTAKLIEHKLNNLRIAHTKLKAECIGVKDYHIEVESYDYQIMNKNLAAILDTCMGSISNEIIKHAYSSVDLTSFKATLCDGRCLDPRQCTFNHGTWDRRRNPFIHLYTSNMCPVGEKGSCPHGMTCKNSHNIYEQKYHPLTFQQKPCHKPQYGSGICQKLFCEFYHKDTPEIIFTPDWEDHLLFGLKNTEKFLSGAVQNLRKLQNQNKGFTKILVISPSETFLDILKTSFMPLFKSYGKNCSLVNKDYIHQREINDVLMGTPEQFSNAVYEIDKKIANIVLIIIDDFKTIVDDIVMMQNLFVLFENIKNFLTLSEVNLILTVEEFDPKIPYFASRFFNRPFKVVPPEGNEIPSGFSNKVGMKRTDLTLKQKMKSESLQQEINRRLPLDNSEMEINVEKRNVPLAKADIPPQEKLYRQEVHSEQKDCQFQQPRNINRNSETFSGKGTFGEHSNWRYGNESSGEFRRDTKSTENRSSKWMPPTHSGHGSVHSNNEINIFQQREAAKENNTLVKDEQSLIRSALIMLLKFSQNVKYLGHQQERVMKRALNLEAHSSQMMQYLSNDVNISLIKNTVQDIAATRMDHKTLFYENILELSMGLLNIIGRHPCSPPKMPDVDRIARDTFGKDSVFILEVVQTSLVNNGHSNPSKELINKLFLDVCSLHFNMTVE